MVSDPESDKYIYWSENGDSFFGQLRSSMPPSCSLMYGQCQIATSLPSRFCLDSSSIPTFPALFDSSTCMRSVSHLPRLRQMAWLMRADKVPHLNSSVLNNEAPSELWEFINPLFKRDQPELLNRITRKQRPANAAPLPVVSPGTGGSRTSARQAAQGLLPEGMAAAHGLKYITDGSTQGEVNGSGVLVGPQGQQYVDISALTTHIANIQRTQGTIAADLKALKASNEHLWRESLEVRDTQKRHQETIDLIVSFLERLFGTDGEGLKGLKEAMLRSGMGGARSAREDSEGADRGNKKRRLGEDRMIMSGQDEHDKRLVELHSGELSEACHKGEMLMVRSRPLRRLQQVCVPYRPQADSVKRDPEWAAISIEI